MSNGIWEFLQEKDLAPVTHKISLNEGNTPLEELTLGKLKTFAKREDLNPTGSFKDRSLVYQLSYYKSQDKNDFVISSSGNAAISAAEIIKHFGGNLHIFVSKKLNPEKRQYLNDLADRNIHIHFSDKAKSDAIKFSQENKLINLRGSQDEFAIVGFKTVAYELLAQNTAIDAIFIPCSSGTSALGIMQGFAENNMRPALHVCQTTRINPLAKEFDKAVPTQTSLADAITDRVMSRKPKIKELINRSNGFAWTISDNELLKAQKACNLEISYNSLLAVAGFQKASHNGFNYNNPVLIISGR